jgi:hypothetical protein
MCLTRIDRLDVVSGMLPPVRKARDRALAVWTRAVPEESVEDGSEVNEDAVDVNESGFGFPLVRSRANGIFLGG